MVYDLTILVKDSKEKGEMPVNNIQKLVGDLGGKVTKNEDLGTKRLAYKIQNQESAHFFSLNIELDGAKTRDLDNGVKVEDSILRYLLLRKED
ncbi:MAG TPA: 30S ribosomal protein S6 [Patescibacteria group bacterium]